MREIKFRAWIGYTMEYSIMAGFVGAFYVNPQNGGIDPNDAASLSPFNTIYSNVVPIMQYTGLKDKNGVEIYEGDILEAYGSLMYVVNWCDTYCQYTYSTITNQDGMYTLSVGQVRKDSNVIGNIYENPELLQS